jgi:hypothetical protein
MGAKADSHLFLNRFALVLEINNDTKFCEK